MLRTAKFDGERTRSAAGGFALATELADFMAMRGVPFREAHHTVGSLVKRCEELGASLEEIPDEELRSAHPALADFPKNLLTPEGSVRNKKSMGSTSPESVERQFEEARRYLEKRAASQKADG
jgi:argininosuccinate lyase